MLNFLKFLILLIIIIIIFYIFNNYILKKDINEHYLTYFLPYYNIKDNDLATFYNNNNNNDNYFKKKFNYDVLKIGTIILEKELIESIISNYIEKSYLFKADVIYYTNRVKLIDDLVNNKLNFCDTNWSTIIYYRDILKKSINNLRLIKSLYKLYFYFFTLKKYNVFTIDDIPPNFIIGIIQKDNIYYYYKSLLADLGYVENIDYKIKFYENLNNLLLGLTKSECNLIIIYDIFPKKQLNIFLNNNSNEDIILLPFEIKNEKLFLKKQKILDIDYIDLNKLSPSYLPKKFSKYSYTKNKPTIKMIYTYKIILSNIQTNPLYTRAYIDFFANNYKKINNSTEEGYHILGIHISNYSNGVLLDFHKGVMDYLIEKGHITYTNNNNCKYLFGTSACNEKTLADNGLIMTVD